MQVVIGFDVPRKKVVAFLFAYLLDKGRIGLHGGIIPRTIATVLFIDFYTEIPC
jgi:hypothetical protein